MNSSAVANWIYLAHYLAWPAVVLIAVTLYRNSINLLFETLAKRSVKFSVSKFQFELGQLSRSPIEAAQLKPLGGRAVNSSLSVEIAKSIRGVAEKDYLVVDIGSGKDWLTSRLFILAAILERIGGLRCFVFVSNADSNRGFVGAATPRNVRWSLGVWYPWLERAFAIAYGELAKQKPQVELFQRGLVDSLIDPLIAGFLKPITDSKQLVTADPTQPEIVVDLLYVKNAEPKDNWVHLCFRDENWVIYTTLEHASWIDAALLKDVLSGRLDQAVVGRAPLPKTAPTIIGSSGTFVALVNEQMLFEELFDRSKLLDQISGQVAAKMTEEMLPPTAAHPRAKIKQTV
jgi:hypothetical protein